MESWNRHAWVTRTLAINAYSVEREFSGWTIGAGGVISCRLYDKTLEIRKQSKKFYLHELWKRTGWNGEDQVWRLEFQLKREVLTQKGLSKLTEVLDNLNGLWSCIQVSRNIVHESQIETNYIFCDFRYLNPCMFHRHALILYN